MDKDKQDRMLNAIPDLNGEINYSAVRGIFTSKPPQVLDLLSSVNGKITSLLITLPNEYFKKNDELYLSYLHVVEELAAKFDDTQLVLLAETEGKHFNEKEQQKIDKIKSRLKNGSEVLVYCIKEANDNAFSIWSQDAFLIANPKNNNNSDLKYLINPASYQRNNRRNDGSIAKGVIAGLTPGYTPLNFPSPIEGGNVLVADDFILIGQDEIVHSKMTDNGFRKQFQSFFGDEKPLIPISVKYTKPKKPEELRTRSGKRGGDTRDLFIIKDTKNNQLHHDIYRWRGKEQPLFHIDLFVTLLGRDTVGKQLIMVGEPVKGFDANELDKHTQQLFDYQFNDVERRITECLQNLERDLQKNGIQYEILRNPLPLTYHGYGWDTSWYWASYNNCLIEITDTQKTVWLPSYGTDTDINNPHWNDLKKYDEQQVNLLRRNGFKVHLFNQDFHFLASKSGSLHCMTKCLCRSIRKPFKIHSLMSDYKLQLNLNGTTELYVYDGKKEYIIKPSESEKAIKGCMLKVDNGKLLVEETILQRASLSMRLAVKGIEEIDIKEIGGSYVARGIVHVDFRERHGMQDKELTFKLDKTWVSFHIEREMYGPEGKEVSVDYLIVNSKPDM